MSRAQAVAEELSLALNESYSRQGGNTIDGCHVIDATLITEEGDPAPTAFTIGVEFEDGERVFVQIEAI